MWRGTKVTPQVTFGLAAACGSGHQGTHQVGRAAPSRLICLLSAQVHTSVVLQTHVSPRTLPGTALDCATGTAHLQVCPEKYKALQIPLQHLTPYSQHTRTLAREQGAHTTLVISHTAAVQSGIDLCSQHTP